MTPKVLSVLRFCDSVSLLPAFRNKALNPELQGARRNMEERPDSLFLESSLVPSGVTTYWKCSDLPQNSQNRRVLC